MITASKILIASLFCSDADGNAAADGLEEEEEEAAFSPEKGNIVFASAYDGWGFRTSQFAAIYAEKLGCNPKALEKVDAICKWHAMLLSHWMC